MYRIFALFILVSCVSGPTGKELAELKRQPGYQIYLSKNCAKCHGKYGQGIFGNRVLKGQPFRASYIAGKVRGQGSKEMPVYAKNPLTKDPEGFFISDKDLAVLAKFLEKNWSVPVEKSRVFDLGAKHSIKTVTFDEYPKT